MNRTFKLEKGSAYLNSVGGISLVGQAFSHCGLDEVFAEEHRKGFRFQDTDIIKSLVGILSQAREKFTDISQFRDDEVFMKSLGLHAVPSEESLRQRLEMMNSLCNDKLNIANQNLLKKQRFGSICQGGLTFIPVDLDVSPLDNSGSKKEHVSFTYKKHDGYAPMFGYIGTEGFMILNELRPGSQHSQKGMPAVLALLRQKLNELNLEHPALIRLDGAHDAEANFDHISSDAYFIVKRNQRKEISEQWLATARRIGRNVCGGKDKNVFVGEVHHRSPGNNEKREVVPVIFKVTEFLEDEQGEPLLVPKIKVETWWTNLPLEAQDVIALYHDHGTSEQYHSELKTDMNVERLPSGKFAPNQIYLNCAMLAFNLLRMIGQSLICNKKLAPVKIKGQRRRLRTVIRDLVFVACRLVKHSGAEVLKFGRHCPWFEVFAKISQSL